MEDEELRPVPKVSKKAVQVQKEFIKNWTGDNQEAFMEVMDQIREKDPRSWAKLYIEHEKMIVPRTTDVNVKHGLDRDMQELVLLGMTAGKPRQLTDNVRDDLEVFAHYEEIREPVGRIGQEWGRMAEET